MEKLFIEGKKNTPQVILDPINNFFELSGESRPENATLFYEGILNWLNDYLTELISSGNKSALVFRIQLEYFNSSSAKFIMTIAQKLYEFIANNIPFSIDWYYDEDDDCMMETGEDLSSLSKVPIRLICVQ